MVLVHIPNVLDAAMLGNVRLLAEGLQWGAGAATAGWHARAVKNNDQALAGPVLQRLQNLVVAALQANPVLQSMALPRRILPPLVSRCEAGQGYGTHVDDALIGAAGIRSDLSVTVFLSDPETYAGGELMVETLAGEDDAKFPAGDAVLYPSSLLHRVAPVTAGQRLVAVTWIESRVRDPGQREILFDLDRVRRAIFDKEGKTGTFDLVAKSYANLLRSWADG